MNKLARFVGIISIFFTSSIAAPAIDSATIKENAKFLDESFGISNVKFYSSIQKSIQGTYVSTLFFDSLNSEKDTTFVLKITDSIIETRSLVNKVTKSEKAAFFATGTHKTSNAEFFVTYSTNEVFFFLTKSQGKYADFGDYSILILYQDKNGPASMNFILRKSK